MKCVMICIIRNLFYEFCVNFEASRNGFCDAFELLGNKMLNHDPYYSKFVLWILCYLWSSRTTQVFVMIFNCW